MGHWQWSGAVAAARSGVVSSKRLRKKLEDWRGLLARNVESGREVLRALLVGPLRFMPVNEPRRVGYAFEGSIALDRLVSGVSSYRGLAWRPRKDWHSFP